jgi:hypothetical protein
MIEMNSRNFYGIEESAASPAALAATVATCGFPPPAFRRARLVQFSRQYCEEKVMGFSGSKKYAGSTLSQYPLTLHILFSTKKGKEALSSFLTGNYGNMYPNSTKYDRLS